jgi:hypothetical protein
MVNLIFARIARFDKINTLLNYAENSDFSTGAPLV